MLSKYTNHLAQCLTYDSISQTLVININIIMIAKKSDWLPDPLNFKEHRAANF